MPRIKFRADALPKPMVRLCPISDVVAIRQEMLIKSSPSSDLRLCSPYLLATLTIYIQLTSPTSTPMSDSAPGHSKSSMDGTTINFNSAKGQNEPLPIPENNELDRYVTDDLPRQPRMAAKPQVPDAIMVNIACFGHPY